MSEVLRPDMQRRLMWVLLMLAFFFQGVPPSGLAAEASGTEATEVVARFQSVLLSTMKDANRLGFRGRYARLEPAVKQSHDLSRIARLTTGRYWRSLDEQQQARFIDTFTRLVIATYAHQFDAYSGESFKRETVQTLKRGRIFVRSVLIKSDGKRVHLDYVLQHSKGNWLIINIIADGVSDLALKRVEYSTVLRRDGFNVLVGMLERKIAQYQ